jgi:hypothetical protein
VRCHRYYGGAEVTAFSDKLSSVLEAYVLTVSFVLHTMTRFWYLIV